jgi:deazaflavin-dependent oxidoreductase (nitroreductase family)
LTVADRLARFNRLPNRLVRTFARWLVPLAVVVHRGRRSGRRYRTPVAAFRAGDAYVISLPYGVDRDWVRNVLAAGGCTLERGGRRLELTRPSLLRGGDGVALMPAPLRPAVRLLRLRGFLRLSATRRDV